MKKTYIFGKNALAQLLAYYLQTDKKPFDGFVLNEKYLSKAKYEGNFQPLLSIESAIASFGSENIAVYLPVGYAEMNRVRASIYLWLRQNGIEVLSYIHQSVSLAGNAVLGEGNIILENVTIQPFVTIGSCNVFWNGANISHHARVGSYNWFAPSSTLSGRVAVGDKCFLGSGSVIKNGTAIGDRVLIGAGAYVNKDLQADSVFVPQRGCRLETPSSEMHLE